MVKIDLHTHSNVSDGLLTPAALVREARRRGVCILALTDHETVAGLKEAEDAAKEVGIEFVPGVELNADFGPHEAHILGYYIDRNDHDLVAALASLERQRVDRIGRIVERLAQIGIPVDWNRVRELAGRGTIGRPHVARAMIERGYVATVAEAFDRYLAAGRPGFVPRRLNDPVHAVEVIRRARGIPVLAHPLTTGDVEAVLHLLVPEGLMGLEVYYGEYEPTVQRELRATADRWNLIPTGGSDYHGEGFKHGRDLGGAPVPAESISRLRAALEDIRTRANWDSPPTAQR